MHILNLLNKKIIHTILKNYQYFKQIYYISKFTNIYVYIQIFCYLVFDWNNYKLNLLV